MTYNIEHNIMWSRWPLAMIRIYRLFQCNPLHQQSVQLVIWIPMENYTHGKEYWWLKWSRDVRKKLNQNWNVCLYSQFYGINRRWEEIIFQNTKGNLEWRFWFMPLWHFKDMDHAAFVVIRQTYMRHTTVNYYNRLCHRRNTRVEVFITVDQRHERVSPWL